MKKVLHILFLHMLPVLLIAQTTGKHYLYFTGCRCGGAPSKQIIQQSDIDAVLNTTTAYRESFDWDKDAAKREAWNRNQPYSSLLDSIENSKGDSTFARFLQYIWYQQLVYMDKQMLLYNQPIQNVALNRLLALKIAVYLINVNVKHQAILNDFLNTTNDILKSLTSWNFSKKDDNQCDYVYYYLLGFSHFRQYRFKEAEEYLNMALYNGDVKDLSFKSNSQIKTILLTKHRDFFNAFLARAVCRYLQGDKEGAESDEKILQNLDAGSVTMKVKKIAEDEQKLMDQFRYGNNNFFLENLLKTNPHDYLWDSLNRSAYNRFMKDADRFELLQQCIRKDPTVLLENCTKVTSTKLQTADIGLNGNRITLNNFNSDPHKKSYFTIIAGSPLENFVSGIFRPDGRMYFDTENYYLPLLNMYVMRFEWTGVYEERVLVLKRSNYNDKTKANDVSIPVLMIYWE